LIITTCHHTHHHRFLCKETWQGLSGTGRPFVPILRPVRLKFPHTHWKRHNGTKKSPPHSMGNENNLYKLRLVKAHQVRHVPELDTCLGSIAWQWGPYLGKCLPPRASPYTPPNGEMLLQQQD
jgi:hypothetical protein